MRASMLEDFRKKVLSLWPLEDLTGLGVAPTSYIDDQHAFAFLPFDVAQAAKKGRPWTAHAWFGHPHALGGRGLASGHARLAVSGD